MEMCLFQKTFLLAAILVCHVCGQECKTFRDRQREHRPVALTTEQFLQIAEDVANEDDFKVHLKKLLIERPVGSKNHQMVREYIEQTLLKLNYSLENDVFDVETVIGPKKFVNIVAHLNPHAPRRVVIACHYDSKMLEGFLGATDAAVPCAMVLNLATTLNSFLRDRSRDDFNELTLTLIFFDGEEAFLTWSDQDSLYGSRHLAQKWANTLYTDESCEDKGEMSNNIHRIDVFVLLDLLGHKNPRVLRHNYGERDGNPFHDLVYELEALLDGLNGNDDAEPIFLDRTSKAKVSDDHMPFVELGLDRVLLVLPVPFPTVWHTLDDDASALHMPTIAKLNQLIRVFVAQYTNM